MKALDLFCGAGGVSVGLARAGFEVVGVDSNPKCERYWQRGMEPHIGQFISADALEVLDEVDWLLQFDLICASPPCQGYSSLRHLCKGKVYPKLIGPVRERLDASGVPWVIENVPGAPLGESGNLVKLCGTMFGLQTPDGRAEIRRHRLFESSFALPQPACRHGYAAESMSVTGTGMGVGGKDRWRKRSVITVSGDRPNSSNTPRRALGVYGERPQLAQHVTRDKKRAVLSVAGHTSESPRARHRERKTLCVAGGKAMSGGMMTPPSELKRRAEEKLARARSVISVTGNTPQRNVIKNQVRETFSIDDARAAMGIDWMPMKYLSQAIPPAYAEWIGRVFLGWIPEGVQLPLGWNLKKVDPRSAHESPFSERIRG